jgi:hypothetical protein
MESYIETNNQEIMDHTVDKNWIMFELDSKKYYIYMDESVLSLDTFIDIKNIWLHENAKYLTCDKFSSMSYDRNIGNVTIPYMAPNLKHIAWYTNTKLQFYNEEKNSFTTFVNLPSNHKTLEINLYYGDSLDTLNNLVEGTMVDRVIVNDTDIPSGVTDAMISLLNLSHN